MHLIVGVQRLKLSPYKFCLFDGIGAVQKFSTPTGCYTDEHKVKSPSEAAILADEYT